MAIKFEEVSFLNPIDKEPYINKLSLHILDDEIVGFIGKSGCGKSILLELMGGLKYKDSGIIKINDYYLESENKSLTKILKNVGFMTQHPEKLFFCETVKDEIEFALKNYNVKNIEKQIHNSLKMVGLNDSYLERNPFDLSQGEKRMLSLAIVLAYNPKILLLDEPVLGLDSRSRDYVIKLIKMMKYRYHKTIVISTNDTDLLLEVADKIYLMNKGKIVISGGKYEILSNTELLTKNDINIPKFIYFSELVNKKKNKKIRVHNDINDLIKDVYRHVK